MAICARLRHPSYLTSNFSSVIPSNHHGQTAGLIPIPSLDESHESHAYSTPTESDSVRFPQSADAHMLCQRLLSMTMKPMAADPTTHKNGVVQHSAARNAQDVMRSRRLAPLSAGSPDWDVTQHPRCRCLPPFRVILCRRYTLTPFPWETTTRCCCRPAFPFALLGCDTTSLLMTRPRTRHDVATPFSTSAPFHICASPGTRHGFSTAFTPVSRLVLAHDTKSPPPLCIALPSYYFLLYSLCLIYSVLETQFHHCTKNPDYSSCVASCARGARGSPHRCRLCGIL